MSERLGAGLGGAAGGGGAIAAGVGGGAATDTIDGALITAGATSGGGNEMVGAVLVQCGSALRHGARTPGFLGCFTGKGAGLALLQHFDSQDVPATHTHDGQNQQHALGDRVRCAPQSGDAVWIFGGFRCL